MFVRHFVMRYQHREPLSCQTVFRANMQQPLPLLGPARGGRLERDQRPPGWRMCTESVMEGKHLTLLTLCWPVRCRVTRKLQTDCPVSSLSSLSSHYRTQNTDCCSRITQSYSSNEGSAWKLMVMMNYLDQYQHLSRGLVGGNQRGSYLLHLLCTFLQRLRIS